MDKYKAIGEIIDLINLIEQGLLSGVPAQSVIDKLRGNSIKEDDLLKDRLVQVKGKLIDHLDTVAGINSRLERNITPFKLNKEEIINHLKSIGV